MTALAMAMILTGAGTADAAQQRRPPPPPSSYPTMMPLPPEPPPAMPPQRARANLGAYFSADDYPAMEGGRQEGTVGFSLIIGPNGRVTDCRVTSSSGSSALDSTTCHILRSRARYTPARDSAGNPTTGSDSGRVSWRLPEETATPAERRAGIPVPFTPAVPRAPLQSYVSARDYPAAALRTGAVGISSVRLVVGMTGRVIACDVDDHSGSAALGAAACRIARARALYAAARSRAGGFVCDVAFEQILWRLPPRRRAGRGAAGAATAPPPIARQLAPGVCPGRAP